MSFETLLQELDLNLDVPESDLFMTGLFNLKSPPRDGRLPQWL